MHLPKWAALCRVCDGPGEVKTSGRLDDDDGLRDPALKD
jgi:hypothetical protein